MRALIAAVAFVLVTPSAFAQDSDTTTITSPHRTIQNGDTVPAVQGGQLMLQLGVNSSTGEHWEIAQKPDFLSGGVIDVTDTPGQALGSAAPQLATISFDVTGAGTGNVVLQMHGPAPHSLVLATFHVTVVAH